MLTDKDEDVTDLGREAKVQKRDGDDGESIRMQRLNHKVERSQKMQATSCQR